MAIKRRRRKRNQNVELAATIGHRWQLQQQIARMTQLTPICLLVIAIVSHVNATTPSSLNQVIKSTQQDPSQSNSLQSTQNQNQNQNQLNLIFQPQQQQQHTSQILPTSNQSYNNLRYIANLLNQRAIITGPGPPNSIAQQQQQQHLQLLQSQQDQQTLQQALVSGQSPTTSGSFQLKLLGSINDTLFVNLSPIEGANNHQPRIEFRSQQFAQQLQLQQQQQQAAVAGPVGPINGVSKAPFVPTVTLDERVQNNTFVAAVVTNDPDSGPSGEVDLAIERGNELAHFKLAKLTATSSTHTILVSGAPLNAYELSEYNLTLVARDKGQPPKFSSANLLIKLNASSLQSPQTRSFADGQYQHQLHHLHQFSAKEAALTHVAIMLVIIFFLSILITVIVCALVRTRHSIKDKCCQLSQSGQPARASSSATTTTTATATATATSTATAANHIRSSCRDHCLCLGHTNL